jgi:hypothetical protein
MEATQTDRQTVTSVTPQRGGGGIGAFGRGQREREVTRAVFWEAEWPCDPRGPLWTPVPEEQDPAHPKTQTDPLAAPLSP